MQDPSNLRVWHLAKELAVAVVDAVTPEVARQFPGLRGQVSASALSVAANIAEGCGRPSPAEFCRFLDYAIASLLETESHLDVAADDGVILPSTHTILFRRIAVLRRMLRSLHASVSKRIR